MIDEAHYFLHEPNVGELLDLTLGAYTLVTYRLADLHPNLRNAIECIIVKRTTEPRENRTLMTMLQAKGDCSTVTVQSCVAGLGRSCPLAGHARNRRAMPEIQIVPAFDVTRPAQGKISRCAIARGARILVHG